MQKDATEGHCAIEVRKEMVKVPLMNLKFDSHIVKG